MDKELIFQQLSEWMREKEGIAESDPSLLDLAEEISQMSLDAETLLEVSNQFLPIYTQLLEKADYVNA